MSIDTSEIMEAVRSTGWCRLGPMSDTEYRDVVARLGKPWCETAVELRRTCEATCASRRRFLFTRTTPTRDLMSWHCEVQDESDGTQQLVDGLASLQACGTGGCATCSLRSTRKCEYAQIRRRRKSLSCVQHPPGIGCSSRRWIKPVEANAHSAAAFAAFCAEIERRTEMHVQEVRLNEGEVLVIDNGRMLHGRRALQSAAAAVCDDSGLRWTPLNRSLVSAESGRGRGAAGWRRWCRAAAIRRLLTRSSFARRRRRRGGLEAAASRRVRRSAASHFGNSGSSPRAKAPRNPARRRTA